MDQAPVDWAEQFVMIASTPRCGSHFLGHMLGATGECGVPLEYLNAINARYWARRFGVVGLDALFPHIVRHRTTPNGTFTFKAHWKQFAPMSDQLDALTKGVGLSKVIWISRRNLLSQAISFTIAEQTGVWISGARATGEAQYDYGRIVKAAQTIHHANDAWAEYMAALPEGQGLSLTYEDLLTDDDLVARVGTFLGLSKPLVPSERTKRQSTTLNDTWKAQFTSDVLADDMWVCETTKQVA